MEKFREFRIDSIREDIKAIRSIENDIMNAKINVSIANPEEHLVRHNIFEVWQDYSFMINECLYHISNSLDTLQNNNKTILDMVNNKEDTCLNGKLYVPASPLYDSHSFEFDALLVSFFRLNEKEINGEAKRYISCELREELEKNRLKKKEVLFWRIKALRNRAAHNLEGMYVNRSGEAMRFCTCSARINICEIKKGRIFLHTCLIDIGKIANIEYLINKVNNRETNEIDVVTELLKEASISKSPKGDHKKDATMMYPNSDILFDMYNDYLDLAQEMTDISLV